MDKYHSENGSYSNSFVGNKVGKTSSLLKKRSNQNQLEENLAAKTPKTDCQLTPVSGTSHNDLGSSTNSSIDAS